MKIHQTFMSRQIELFLFFSVIGFKFFHKNTVEDSVKLSKKLKTQIFSGKLYQPPISKRSKI